MKKILVAALLVLTSWSVQGQGIEFFEGTWEEALMEAQAQEKVIFVDAYAVWCGPCRRMANNVFTNSKVGEFYNEHFINLKLDMEQEEGMRFRQTYPVAAFPTLYYIDFNGEVVNQMRGAQDVEGFIRLGEVALNMIDRSANFAEAYENGDRSPELVYEYVKALNQAGKPTLKISNDYLREQDDLTTEQNLLFILEATVEADSRIFGLLVKHRDAIEALVGADAVQERILYASTNTAQKAADFKVESLLEEAQAAMKSHCPEMAKQFVLESNLEYYLARRDRSGYLKAAKAFGKKGDADTQEFYRMSQDLYAYFSEDAKCRKQAEAYAKKACEDSEQFFTYLHYARLLQESGKLDEAIEVAKQALELAKIAGRGPTIQVERFLQELEG